MKKMKTCYFCNNPLGKEERKFCRKPECQEKKKDYVRKKNRENNLRSARKKRAKRLAADPKYCLHCGKAFSVDDDRKLLVCRRDECQAWWKVEKIERVRERSKNYVRRKNVRPSPAGRASARASQEDYGPDDWSHEKYLKQEEELKKPNGRVCLRNGCKTACVGVYYFCELHRNKNIARANAVDLRNDVVCTDMLLFV